jgi:hypothetical protein
MIACTDIRASRAADDIPLTPTAIEYHFPDENANCWEERIYILRRGGGCESESSRLRFAMNRILSSTALLPYREPHWISGSCRHEKIVNDVIRYVFC